MCPVTNFHPCPFISLLSYSCRLSSAFSCVCWLCAFLNGHPWAFAFLQMLQCREGVAKIQSCKHGVSFGNRNTACRDIGEGWEGAIYICVFEGKLGVPFWPDTPFWPGMAWCVFLNIIDITLGTLCTSVFFFFNLLSLCRMSICSHLLGRAWKSPFTNQWMLLPCCLLLDLGDGFAQTLAVLSALLTSTGALWSPSSA